MRKTILILAGVLFPAMAFAANPSSSTFNVFAASLGPAHHGWGNTYSMSLFNGNYGVSVFGTTSSDLKSSDLKPASAFPNSEYPVNSYSIGDKTIDPAYGAELLLGHKFDIGWDVAPAIGLGLQYYKKATVYESAGTHLLYAQKTRNVYRLSATARIFIRPSWTNWVFGVGYNNLRGGFFTVGYRY